MGLEFPSSNLSWWYQWAYPTVPWGVGQWLPHASPPFSFSFLFFFLEESMCLFFSFLRREKGNSRVTVIVPRPMVQLGKPMSTTSSNWSSETPNPHIPQALLVSGTSRNCNYSPRENSNLGCDKVSAVTYQLYHTCW